MVSWESAVSGMSSSVGVGLPGERAAPPDRSRDLSAGRRRNPGAPQRFPSRNIGPPRSPPMKIAQIAPLAESVPPRLYGGTERIVSYLTEELVAQGHDVTLFASGDSETARPARAMHPGGAPPQPGGARSAAAPPPDARAGPPARAGLRHPALPHRPHAVPAAAHHRHARGDDAARPARPARPHALLPRLPRRAAGLHLRRPARADAAGQLGAHHPPRPAARPLPLQPARQPAATSPSSAASRPRSAPTAPSRSPPAPACRSGSPPRSTTPTSPTGRTEIEPLVRGQPAGRVRGRDRRAREGRLPRQAPRRSSSPSTGRSRSASS